MASKHESILNYALNVVHIRGFFTLLKKTFSILLLFSLIFTTVTVQADEVEDRKWEDEIIYSLIVDRFYNGNSENDFEVNMKDINSYNGGDFAGIEKRLDYLKDMGFTVIQLSSIFENEDGGYHGQWITDYYSPEQHFGTMKEFNKLVKAAHDKGMKIILEFPVLPNYSNTDIQDAAKWWVENTEIDGYKIPNVKSRSIEFWKQFIEIMKQENENFYVSAQDKVLSDTDMKALYSAGFDGVSTISLVQPLRDAFSNTNKSAQSLLELTKENSDLSGIQEVFFDNKDTTRFTRDMVESGAFPGSSWKLALTYLYTQPSVPVIFYATEIAVNGGEAPENIPLMNFRTDEELIDFITDLGKVRQEQPALTRGSMDILHEDNGLIAFKRQYESDTVVVVINNTDVDQNFIIPASDLEDEKELRGLLGTDLVRSDNGEYKIFIDREGMEIYKLTDKSGINVWFIIALFAVFGSFILFMYIAWKRGKNRIPE